jgi:hypothetical protein
MNKILLSLTPRKNRPTMEDLVKPSVNRKAKIVFRASLEDSKKDQDKILKKAASISR